LIDRTLIGRVSGLSHICIERLPLRQYALAIAETNPIYTDMDAARAAGFADLPATLTYITTLENFAPPPGAQLTELGISFDGLLHGEQSFQYLAPLCAGDNVTLQTTVIDVYEKRGGTMKFIELQTEARTQQGVVAVRSNTVLIVQS
jgi:acyl dehydratase